MNRLKLTAIFIMSFCFLTQHAYAQEAKDNYLTKKTVTGKAKKYYDKGMEYISKGDNTKALNEFSKALKAAPNLIDAQIQWAAIHYELNNLEQAEAGFEKVVELNPSHTRKVLYVLGKVEM